MKRAHSQERDRERDRPRNRDRSRERERQKQRYQDRSISPERKQICSPPANCFPFPPYQLPFPPGFNPFNPLSFVPFQPPISAPVQVATNSQKNPHESSATKEVITSQAVVGIPREIIVTTKGRISCFYTNQIFSLVHEYEQTKIIKFVGPINPTFKKQAKRAYLKYLARNKLPIPSEKVLEAHAIIRERNKIEEIAYSKYITFHKAIYLLAKRKPLSVSRRISREIPDTQKYLTRQLNTFHFSLESSSTERSSSPQILVAQKPGRSNDNELLRAIRQIYKNAERAESHYESLSKLEANTKLAAENIYKYLSGGKKIDE